MGNLEDEIRAEQIKNRTGAYAKFTSIDGIGQKTAKKLRGLRGVETPSDIKGESAETLADRAGISENRAAKAIRGGGGNAQVRGRLPPTMSRPSAEPAVQLSDVRETEPSTGDDADGTGGQETTTATSGAGGRPASARVEANGRFMDRPPSVEPAPESPGARSGDTGRYIGDEIVDPADPDAPIQRDPETGQFYAQRG